MAAIYNTIIPPPPKAVHFVDAFLLKYLDHQGRPIGAVMVDECVLPPPLLLLPPPTLLLDVQIHSRRVQKVQQ
jgi:hypothetical protein